MPVFTLPVIFLLSVITHDVSDASITSNALGSELFRAHFAGLGDGGVTWPARSLHCGILGQTMLFKEEQKALHSRI